jgi:hypothetical protein
MESEDRLHTRSSVKLLDGMIGVMGEILRRNKNINTKFDSSKEGNVITLAGSLIHEYADSIK